MNEFLQKFRQENPDYQDWSDADLMYGLHEKFYSDMTFDEFRAMVEQGGPVNTGPTEQPPFPTLPPMVGGALDMLVAFGTGSLRAAGLNTNVLVPGATEGYMAEVRQRAPGVTKYTEGAGAATLGAVAGLAAKPLFAARTATVAPRLVQSADGLGMVLTAPTTQAIPSIAGQAARSVGGALKGGAGLAGQLMRNRIAQIGSGIAGGALLQRILGGDR